MRDFVEIEAFFISNFLVLFLHYSLALSFQTSCYWVFNFFLVDKNGGCKREQAKFCLRFPFKIEENSVTASKKCHIRKIHTCFDRYTHVRAEN